MMPTRLDRSFPRKNHRHDDVKGAMTAHLDSDNAQLTLYKLGLERPGYVKVQLVIFRIARVLLRTPIREPGGGNANFTEVAASV